MPNINEKYIFSLWTDRKRSIVFTHMYAEYHKLQYSIKVFQSLYYKTHFMIIILMIDFEL